MRGRLLALQLFTLFLAAAVAAAPLADTAVERYYSGWFYPALQARLTSWANEVGIALFDLMVAVLLLAGGVVLWRGIASALHARRVLPAFKGLLALATIAAAAFLWFQLVWGLNYARVPLEARIAYDGSRVTDDAVRALAARAVQETNSAYAAGHAAGFPEIRDVPPALVSAFHNVEQRLGRTRPTVPGRPKRTVFGPLFRASGTSGMHAPFMLETLLNPDLTPPERPAVLAHEWAHLAGYAPEDDASFVGLLAALNADPGARYSAWLSLAFDATAQLPRAERQRLLATFEPGPRKDQEAIVARLQSRIEPVERVSWQTYDRYLKAQGVREGIANYSRVVQLLIGSDALNWPRPR